MVSISPCSANLLIDAEADAEHGVVRGPRRWLPSRDAIVRHPEIGHLLTEIGNRGRHRDYGVVHGGARKCKVIRQNAR